MRAPSAAALAAVVLLLPGAPARAADAPDARLRDALRTTTAQLRGLEEEQGRWQAREAQLKKELETLRAELAEAKKGAGRRGEDRVLRQRLAEQAEAAAKAAAALAQCQKSAEEANAAQASRAKERDEERAEATGRIDGLTRRAASCEARNARAVQAGREFIRWVGERSLLCEPILGLRRVELETRAQDLEDKLLEAKAGP